MIEGYLRDKNKRSKDGGSASGGAAAAAAETTIDSNTTKKVLLLTFHDGVAASVRWAASQLKWDLDVPDLHEDAANDGGGAGGNGEGWLGGCEDAASNRVSIDELGVPWAAAASCTTAATSWYSAHRVPTAQLPGAPYALAAVALSFTSDAFCCVTWSISVTAWPTS